MKDELRNSILLFYTGVNRSSAEILTEQNKDTTNGSADVTQSLHMTKEIGHEIEKALEAGNITRFGELMDMHWQNKKKRSGKISNPRFDYLYDLAKDSGAIGGKIMGAGGGGFFMFCCVNSHKENLRNVMAKEGLREMPFDFDMEGAKVMVNF
jgi:D-glycero-alpha-D-manno-heptose-7-phosphate kinase